MQAVLSSSAIIALGFVLLVAQSAVATLIGGHAFAPNLMLPIVILLGVSPDVSLLRGAIVSFVLGYLLDLFSGNLMSLQTCVLVATFMISRGAGLRLFFRGPAFQLLLAFIVSLLAGGALLALRAIFEDPGPFPVGTPWDTATTLFWPAVATAISAPLLFAPVRRLDAVDARRREEPSAAAT